MATLREVASAGGKLGLHGGIGGDPIGKGIFAVLDDTVALLVESRVLSGSNMDVRFAAFVTIVRSTSLARGDGCIVDQLEKMLAVASDDGEFLAMLA